MKLFLIDNYAINTAQIQLLSSTMGNNRTNIHFTDRNITVNGSIQDVAKAIDAHVAGDTK